MKISNNLIAALALIFIIVSIVTNFIIYLKTVPEKTEISGEATGTLSMCANHRPSLSNLSTLNATINEPYIAYINATDSDNTTLTFTDNSTWLNISYYNRTGSTTVGKVNFTITNESLVGNHTVRVWVNDNLSCDNSQNTNDYNFTIIMYNRAPVLIENIPDFTWKEDTILTGLDLDDYFSDPDGDTLHYNHTSVANIQITINNESVVTFTPDANWYGLRTVTFIANDSINATNSNVVHLTVTNVAEAPVAEAPALAGGGGGGGAAGGVGGAKYECITNWFCTDWSACLPNNTMIRECIDLNNCPDVKDEEKPEESMPCVAFPHCFNGIQDEDEEGVDCGGVDCAPCESCYDGIQNQGETGVDCGGPCPPCEEELATVPCINVTREERKILNIRKGEISKLVKLPGGYSIAISPFNLHCHGRSYDLTVSVPDTFVDVRVLRCTGERCYPAQSTEITELECGGEIIEELLRKEKVLQPEFMPITVEKVNLTLRSYEEILKSGSNKVRFYGEAFQGVKAILKMPEEPVPQPKNPSLKIIGTPIDIEISKAGNGSLGSIIEMPYVRNDEIDEDSIAMYARISDEEWDYLGGNLDKNLKTVTANITDIDKYFIDDKAQFALMGILCVNCLNSTFLKVHEPTKQSRDAIILIHGLAGSVASYQNMIDDIRLTNQPFQVWVFGYPSFKGTDKNAKDLMHHLEAHSSEYDRIFIVAHSVGGLIAQQALYDSYSANKEQKEKYTYVDKVKKIILVAVPNEGTPAAEVYHNLFKHLVNLKSSFNLFRLDEIVLQELVTGRIIPRVPGIKYYVVAGTKPYEFNLLFFKTTTAELLEIFEDNDGIVTVRSAQKVGDSYIKNKCEDFWAVNVTHTGLVSEPVARKVIEKIVSENLYVEPDKPLLGHTNYYKFPVTDCLPDDQFVVIGKKIKVSEVSDATGCMCGNGICGQGENAVNCPKDCAVMFAKERKNIVLIAGIGILGMIMILFVFKITRPYLLKAIIKVKAKVAALKEKRIPVEVKPLRLEILERLDKLEREIPEATLEMLSREFSVIIREFFKRHFNIEYEFTYEELEKELGIKKIDPRLAHVISSFFKRVTQIEFGGGHLTKDELRALIVETRELIELTTEKEPGKVIEKEKPEHKIITVKATGLKRVFVLISEAEIYLREGEVKKAKMLYYDIMKGYNRLSSAKKKNVYEAIKRLYDEIKLTKGK